MSGDISVPVVPGFSVERDVLTNEWVATSASGAYRIRGKSQWELNTARARLYARVLAEFRTAIAELFPPEWKISLRLPRSPLLGLRGHPGSPPAGGDATWQGSGGLAP